MKNKILGILLVMVLAVTGFGLVGCGGKTTPVTPTPTPEPEVPELVDSLVPVAMDETGLMFDTFDPSLEGTEEVDPEEVTLEAVVIGLEEAVSEVVVPAYVEDARGAVYKVIGLADYAFTVGGRQAIGPVEYAYSEGVADDEEEVELVKITLPSTVEFVQEYTFAGCTAIEEIVLNNRETFIDGLYEAFRNLSTEVGRQMENPSEEDFLEYLGTHLNTEDDGLYYLGNTKHPYMYLVMAYGEDFYPQEEAGRYVYAEGAVETEDGVKVTINADCKVIGGLAFAYTAITEVVLPEGLVAIGIDAFDNCNALTTINVPATLKIHGMTGINFSNLTNIYIDNVDFCSELDFMEHSRYYNFYVLESINEEVEDNFTGNNFTRADETVEYNGKEYVSYNYYEPLLL